MRDEEIYRDNLNILKPVLSQDSEIECIFYRKCRSERKYIGLLLEWANEKQIYMRFTRMTAFSHGNYSKHDSTHSIAILESIADVIGRERIEQMQIMDMWLLLHCAYSHDMGMLYSQEEVEKLWAKVYTKSEDEFTKFYQECLESNDSDLREAAEYIKQIGDKLGCNGEQAKKKVKKQETEPEWLARLCKYHRYLVAEYCRKTHAQRVEKMLNEKTELEIYTSSFAVASRLYKYVSKCGRVHGEGVQSLMDIPKREWTQHGNCHPRFVAALLRLGDLLDIDNDRFDSVVLKYYGDIPKISEIHRKKHEAITHIDLSTTTIAITAESDEEEVCKCANEWFMYLQEDVENLIFHWNEIAPEDFGGCLLSRPDTKVFYKGRKYGGRKSGEFIVNKDMLIELVIGKNLYGSRIDFLREYLQNSIDALKMRFWIGVSEGEADHLINVQEPGNRYYTPFDFMESAFEQYNLRVICEWIDRGDREIPKIRITIIDRGIGIDTECLDAIAHIGTGWKGRKQYRQYLRNMPKWLKPTGGFGIGMQSGFMISDKVEIRTKCEGEKYGNQITLYSSQKSGEIETQEIEMANTGTEVSVEIDYDWFLDTRNFSAYDLLQKGFQENEDYFDPEKIMGNVEKIIQNYIQQLFESSLFSIIVKRPKFESVTSVKSSIGENVFFKKLEVDGKKYEVYRKIERYKQKGLSGQLLPYNWSIWETEKENLYRVIAKGDEEKGEIKWFYKGVKVKRDNSPEEEVWADIIGTVMIDIMGIDVKGCLKVDRSEFAEEYDSGKQLQQFMRMYFRIYDTMDELIGGRVTRENMLRIGRKGLLRLIMAHYFADEALRRNIKKQIDGFLENKEKNLSDMDFLDGNNMVTILEKVENKWMRKVSSLWTVFVNIWKGKTIGAIVIEENDTNLSKIIKKNLDKIINMNLDEIIDINLSKIINKNSEVLEKIASDAEIIVADQKIYCLLSSFKGDNLQMKEINGEKYVIYGKPVRHEVEDKDLVFANAFAEIKDNACRQIFRTDEFYKKLFVSYIPWESKTSSAKSKDDKHMIISPIDMMNRNTSIWARQLRHKEEAEQEFLNSIMESKEFEYLVDWVFKYQVEREKYSREDITGAYRELLIYLYNTQLSNVI